MTLSELNVLVLDCQATGASPKKGDLLEIGWMQTAASVRIDNPGPHPVQMPVQMMVALPEGQGIPPQVQRVTGILAADCQGAVQPRDVWRRLAVAAGQTAVANSLGPCPTVVHYARYETPFLTHLQETVSPATEFPLQMICTHQIAGRLFPDLPRLGLRAVAGYFGHSVPEERRCASHVAATAVIWRHLVRVLADAGVQTLEGLVRWMKVTRCPARRGRGYPMNPDVRRCLPDRPGVYRMLRVNGETLYVGKAASLKRRVNSYFHKGRRHGEHILEMLTQAVEMNVTPTRSALEAAILETDEIKRLSPPYNVALRKKGRKPGFCSVDFMDCAVSPDPVHCVGPLPSVTSLQPLAALAEVLSVEQSGPGRPYDRLAALFPKAAAAAGPDSACMAKGVDIFWQRHGALLAPNDFPARVRQLGARLWRLRLAEKASLAKGGATDDTDELEQLGDNPGPWVWTTEAVAACLESMVRRSALWMRRARWFCLLSASTLMWASRDPDCQDRHVVVIDGGRLQPAAMSGGRGKSPKPGSGQHRLKDRQDCFDVATYDRMRVLTTELRRLVAEKRSVSLYLGGSAGLDREKLSRLLPWV